MSEFPRLTPDQEERLRRLDRQEQREGRHENAFALRVALVELSYLRERVKLISDFGQWLLDESHSNYATSKENIAAGNVTAPVFFGAAVAFQEARDRLDWLIRENKRLDDSVNGA